MLRPTTRQLVMALVVGFWALPLGLTRQPTALAATLPETLTAPFTGGPYAATTTQSYSGPVSVTVYGMGQASGIAYNDALYYVTYWATGQAITPYHDPGSGLTVNGTPIDQLVTRIPTYNSQHVYTFVINAPGGQLTFGISDVYTVDNTGAYYIIITPGTTPAYTTEPDLRFPFGSGVWTIARGFNIATHTGYQTYAFDLELNDSPDQTWNQPVYAAADGYLADEDRTTGCVWVRHNQFTDASGTRYYFTQYCHLQISSMIPMVPNQRVYGGKTILGRAGTTGTTVTHVHFALHSATDQQGRFSRRAEMPLKLTSIASDNNGNGPLAEYSYVGDGSTKNSSGTNGQYYDWTVGQP